MAIFLIDSEANPRWRNEMPRKHVDPVIEKIPPPHEGYRESHPSYGMIRASRVSGGHENLYGSSVSHQNHIEIQIVRGHRDRHLNTDWYFGEHKPLISVKLSPSQFSELIANMNCGSGVPCTISDYNGEMMPDCPERHIRQEVTTEFKERMREVGKLADEAIAKLSELEAPGRSVKKSDIREISDLLLSAIADIRSNAPFAQECFNEACDKAVMEAKAEIDAAFTGMVARLGMEAVADRVSELLDMSEPPQAAIKYEVD